MSRTETAWERLREALETGRLAHAYILQGHAKREGRAFVQRLAHALFPGATHRVDAGSHPDILRIEPQSKSRTILVRQVEAVIARMQQKPFEGGWKLAVVFDADRMMPAAANKLLKTLEEPPGKSLLLLVTETPQSLLPTILSRCQLIALDPEANEEEPWRAPLLALLEAGVPHSPLEAGCLAADIKGLLDVVREEMAAQLGADQAGTGEELAKEVVEARVAARTKAVTRDMLRAVQAWYRDLFLIASGCDRQLAHPDRADRLREIGSGMTYTDALRRLRSIETVAMRMEFSPSTQALLEAGLL